MNDKNSIYYQVFKYNTFPNYNFSNYSIAAAVYFLFQKNTGSRHRCGYMWISHLSSWDIARNDPDEVAHLTNNFSYSRDYSDKSYTRIPGYDDYVLWGFVTMYYNEWMK